MKPTPHLTPGEFELIEILWLLGEGCVKDVLDRMPPRRALAYTTVMTVLDKMRRKGILKYRKKGKAYYYSPVIEREQALAAVVDYVIQTYFNGSRSDFLEFVAHGIAPETRAMISPAPRPAAAASTPSSAAESSSMDEFLL